MSSDQTATMLFYFLSTMAQTLAVGFGLVLAMSQWRLDRMRNEFISRGYTIAEIASKVGITADDIIKLQAGNSVWFYQVRRSDVVSRWVQRNRTEEWVKQNQFEQDKEFCGFMEDLAKILAESALVNVIHETYQDLARKIRNAFISLGITIFACIGLIPFAYRVAGHPYVIVIVVCLIIFACIMTLICFIGVIRAEIAPPEINKGLADSAMVMRQTVNSILKQNSEVNNE